MTGILSSLSRTEYQRKSYQLRDFGKFLPHRTEIKIGRSRVVHEL